MGDIDALALVEDIARREVRNGEETMLQFCRRVYDPATVPISYQALVDIMWRFLWSDVIRRDDNNNIYMPS